MNVFGVIHICDFFEINTLFVIELIHFSAIPTVLHRRCLTVDLKYKYIAERIAKYVTVHRFISRTM